MKRAIVFDWDGTLFDSMAYKRENFCRLFEECGADRPQLLDLHRRLSGLPREELFKKIYSAVAGRVMDSVLFQSFSDRYSELNLTSSLSARLFPDVLERLPCLAKDHTLFVSSSSEPSELTSVVARQPIAHLFQEILGSLGDFRKGKPHFSYLMDKYSLKPDEVLFVGDDEQDGVLAHEAGIEFYRVVREAGLSNML